MQQHAVVHIRRSQLIYQQHMYEVFFHRPNQATSLARHQFGLHVRQPFPCQIWQAEQAHPEAAARGVRLLQCDRCAASIPTEAAARPKFKRLAHGDSNSRPSAPTCTCTWRVQSCPALPVLGAYPAASPGLQVNKYQYTLCDGISHTALSRQQKPQAHELCSDPPPAPKAGASDKKDSRRCPHPERQEAGGCCQVPRAHEAVQRVVQVPDRTSAHRRKGVGGHLCLFRSTGTSFRLAGNQAASISGAVDM